tara:strand:- start:780 stop:2543 length:1764 start_codon:yes stop_codon:yes gene_type:complete
MTSKRIKRVRQVKREEIALANFRFRRLSVLFIFSVAICALIWRAVDQQILERDFLQSEGADRYLDKVHLTGHRGLITDRRGDVLALSTPVDSITANPRLLRFDSLHLDTLARSLNLNITELRQKLARYSKKRFVYLKHRLPPAEAKYVLQTAKSNGLIGLGLERSYKRYYPTGEVFSHVIGFANHKDKGQEGIELAYDHELSGSTGSKLVLRDGKRRAVDDVENIKMPQDGKNLALSIDGRIQYIAYRELKAAVKRNRAIGGSAVVLDVNTGEILAMVNQPGFNPNSDRSSKNGRLRNRSLTDVFEPGSTMKPFAVAAALELNAIKLDSIIDTGSGSLLLTGGKIKDKTKLGKINLSTLLGRSSNVGAAKIALMMKGEEFWQFLNKFGFGRSLYIGFPAESSGNLNFWRDWREIDQANLSFGYGVSVNTVQLAKAYATLANGGISIPVTILKRDKRPLGERIISKETSLEIIRMLETVVQSTGTAPQAAITGYKVAGKTGTVKKFGPNGYSEDRYISIFAGIAPATNPRLVMVTIIDEPRGKQFYGGAVVGPVFSNVLDEALRFLNVEPDNLKSPKLQIAQNKVSGK